jgi:hypothetical protein
MTAPARRCAGSPDAARRSRTAWVIFARGARGRALALGLVGPAAPTGGRRLLSLPDRLDIRRHRRFQPFEPWQRRLRPRFSFELALAAEHKACCILESYSSAHNLSLQFGTPRRPVPFPSSVRALGCKPQRGASREGPTTQSHGGLQRKSSRERQASVGVRGSICR